MKKTDDTTRRLEYCIARFYGSCQFGHDSGFEGDYPEEGCMNCKFWEDWKFLVTKLKKENK